MATLTSKLILSLVDRVSAPARGISKQIDSLTRRQQENSRAMRETAGKLGAVSLAAAGVVGAFAAPINAAVRFEESMADVKKVVNFDTPDGFRKLGKDIIAMSTRLPMTAQGISEIVAAAGQSGIAGDELLKFAELASKVGVAFDIGAGETGEALAKIKTQLGLSVGETGELADAINHLSNTSASAAPDLIEFMKRVAAVGKISGLSAEETAAIGSAMIAAGAEADVAATSLRNMTKALSKGTTATKAQRDAYKRLGLNAGQVAKDMQEDATGTIRKVMNAIRELPKHVQQSTVSQLFGDEARALLPLIENTDLLNNALGSVADRANYLGSAQKEYEARAATTANSIQLFRNKVSALGIAIGSALMPALNRIMDVLGPFIQRIAALAEKYPQVTQAVAGASLGLIALTAATLSAKLAMLGLRSVGFAAMITGLRGLGGAGKVAAFGLAPFKFGLNSVKAAIASTRVSLIGFAAAARIAGTGTAFSMMGTSLIGLLNPLRLVKGAFVAMRVALISTGIGAIVVGIAAAGTAIYNNWSGISAMFKAFGDAFMQAIEPVRPAIQPVVDLAGDLKAIWDALTGSLTASDQSWAEFGASAGRAIGDAIAAFIGLPAKIISAIGSIDIFNSFENPIPKILDWFKGLPGRIIEAIGNIDLSGILKWPSLPTWLGGSGSTTNNTTTGKTVSSFSTGGLVNGPGTGTSDSILSRLSNGEFVVRAAAVRKFGLSNLQAINSMQTPSPRGIGTLPMPRSLPAANSNLPRPNSQPSSVTFGDIHIHGGAGATAAEIRSEFSREAGAMMRSRFSDGAA